ncbi:unnamed protein product [marine sediment metagenome]|uniref:Uncharacterized protein n=1 Tax=marine sediment metagenome TaxID=412755 RepID=X1C6Q9_9ZZZZ
MDSNQPILNSKSNNKFLTDNTLTLEQLKIYIRLRYITYKDAGLKAGISACRVRQIITGKNLPKSSKIIHQISEGWGIDPVKLTLLFDKYREEKLEYKGDDENVS